MSCLKFRIVLKLEEWCEAKRSSVIEECWRPRLLEEKQSTSSPKRCLRDHMFHGTDLTRMTINSEIGDMKATCKRMRALDWIEKDTVQFANL